MTHATSQDTAPYLPPRRGSSAMWVVGFLLLAAACLFAIDALSGPGHLPNWSAMASAALAMVAFALADGAGGRLFSGVRRQTAFEAMVDVRDEPAAVVDSEGAVVAANAALRAACAPAEAVELASALRLWTGDAEAVVYTLSNACAETRRAASRDLPGAGRRLTAQPLGGGLALWTIEKTEERAADGTEPAAPAVRAGAEGLRCLVETLPVALARVTPRGSLIFANRAARNLLGPGARPGAEVGRLVESFGRSIESKIMALSRGDDVGRSEIARCRADDRETFLQVSLSEVEFEDGPAFFMLLDDATQLKTLEAQFVQSQKMQAVGQLAGGVAHDFNNVLTAINGHCDLLLLRHEIGDQDYADLVQIQQNGNRAAALVRQLLAFSRKQTMRPKVVDLREALTELSHLLNRLLGEKVDLHLDHGEALHDIRIDERQFEQVVMNLVVNARDAMNASGDVHISTRNVRFEEEFRRDRAVVAPGDYVLIEVSDTGEGMAPEVIGKVFEPFYTTKRVGEGTGLGLSTVYGIVKQTGGFIFVDSAPGKGATFSIYFPKNDETVIDAPIEAPQVERRDHSGEGEVLLVEDETQVRSFAARALRLRGYTVHEASCAEEALEIMSDPDFEVDVLVSDVVMPGMDGPTWVREIRKTRPHVKVIFVSGYAEDVFRRSIDGLSDYHFLPKPFSLNQLTGQVKAAIQAD